MKAYRAGLLRFTHEHKANYDEDGLLVIGDDGRIIAADSYQTLYHIYQHLDIEHFPGKIIAPGFIDLHVHYTQLDVIGSPADGLLPWLENYTFPAEKRFADYAHASEVAKFFFDELVQHGVTTALTFPTSHPESVDAFFSQAQQRGLRMISGKVMQDRHSPDGLCDTTEQSLLDTEDLIKRWHGIGRLGYAITPRFAPTSSPAQLRGAGELASRYPDVWIQTHVAENRDEVKWVGELFPDARSYFGIYEDFGLLRKRAVYAHSIWLDETDRIRMAQSGAAAALSPTSNLFLGSGFFDYAKANEANMAYGLSSDVGGGTSLSPFRVMLAAYYTGREGLSKKGLSLTPENLWWQYTQGAARALGLDGVIGNLAQGCEGDFVILNPKATPLLARRTEQASNLSELLFAMIVLGDDRLVERTHIARVVDPVC